MAKTKESEALAKAAQDKLNAMDKPKVEVEIEDDEAADKLVGKSEGLSDLFRVLADLLKD